MEHIETARLLLRKATIAEYKDLFEHYTQEEAKAFFGFEAEEKLMEEKKKYENGMMTYRTSFVYFFLVEKSSGSVIGDCCFHTWYFPHARAEIGYGLRNEADKNKGYMKEAIQAVVTYGFEVMKLNRIEAFISPDNIPSQKLVVRLGFQHEGLLRQHYCKDGHMLHSNVFGLLREDFYKEPII